MSRRRFAALSLGAAAVLAAAALAPPSDTPSALESQPDGWTDLIATAGPNLDGWTCLPIPAGGKLEGKTQWGLDPARPEVLVCSGRGGHEWLRWNKELGDFVFHVEWRFRPVAEGEKTNYNSGIYARNSEDAKIWHQAQTGDAKGGYLFGDTLVDGQIQRINLSKQVTGQRVRPAGRWNTYEITCRGRAVTLWTNGAVTCKWTDCEVPSGYVGLEAEGFAIEFRNVKLKAL